jgi:hypothetical protein
MPHLPKVWHQYPSQYADLAKSVATETLPARYGPLPNNKAVAFRQSFYRFRKALFVAVNDQSQRIDDYPVRLYEMIEKLSVEIKRSIDDPTQYDVVFDLDPVIDIVNKKINLATAQAQQLAKREFIKINRPSMLFPPMFSDEEMQERLADIEKGQS